MGGKKALRNIIYRLFPKDFGRYIEVFGGGGWVLFGRQPDFKGMEVYNDFNGNLKGAVLAELSIQQAAEKKQEQCGLCLS
mgnify:CR=1 FL=1